MMGESYVGGGSADEVPANVDNPSLVSLVDLFPTVTGIAGAPIPSGLAGSDLMGPIQAERPVLSEYHGEGVHAPCFMLRMGRHKLIYVHGHESHLFDLKTDSSVKTCGIANPKSIRN